MPGVTELGKQNGVQRGHGLTPAAATQVKRQGPPTATSCSLLPLRSAFPMERRLRDGGGELCFLPTAPHPTPPDITPSGREQLGEDGCVKAGRLQDHPPTTATTRPGPGRPSGRALPARSSRSTLTFRQPWSSSVASWLSWPAFLQMDGKDWLQGLSFQRPSWGSRVRRSLSPTPAPPISQTLQQT